MKRTEVLNKTNIEEKYRRLGKWGSLKVTVKWGNILESLKIIENAGFFGLILDFKNATKNKAVISAMKGKEGSCFETGRTAFYKGIALAVMDDDNHFIYKSIRVCEKTGGVYSSKLYRKYLRVTPADTKLLKTLKTNPVSFNCDTFDRDAKLVYEMIAYSREKTEIPVIYLGPFKKIVLNNGTILNRGEAVFVSKDTAKILITAENCVKVNPEACRPSPTIPLNYYVEYNKAGSIFILSKAAADKSRNVSKTLNPETLVKLPEELSEKLLTIINKNIPYLVITGSDPTVEGGCCPNREVYHAKKLVKAGILDSWAPPLPNDACTMTVYAFQDEIEKGIDGPKFRINKVFRAKVRKYLGSRQ